jgi:hypothetical protein
MSEERNSFIELCLQGRVLLDEIDDFVDAWHETDGKKPLHEFLGMKKSEYALWIRDPDLLAYIVKSRHDNVPLRVVVNDNYDRIAARADSAPKIQRLKKWLEEQGKLD